MPYRFGPMEEGLVPARWPAPDYAAEAEVAVAWIPGFTVGHLVIQDESKLAWLSVIGYATSPAGQGARIIVQNILRQALADGKTARETYDEAREAIMFHAPELVKLPELMTELQKEWN